MTLPEGSLSLAQAIFEHAEPGSYHVCWGSSQVSLLMRRVGFEVRDTIAVQADKPQFGILLRKPLEESTVAKQVFKNGQGCLNIDECRIYTDWQEADRPDSWKASGHTLKPEAAKIAAPPGTGIQCHPRGRWPTNLVFVHGQGCKRVGTTKVPGHKGYPNGPGGKSMQYSSDERGENVRPDAWEGHADKDGMETIPVWDCVEGCSVKTLGQQSDTSASRFFPQLESVEAAEEWAKRLVQLPKAE